MKTLVIGDLQIECSNPASDRAQQTRDTLSWVLQVAAAERPEMVVHLGDFGESNQGVDHYSLSLMTWFAANLRQIVPQCWWLVGNHDFFTDDGAVNLMTSLGPLLEAAGHNIAWPWKSGPEGTTFLSYLKPGAKDSFRAEMGLLFSGRESTVLFSHYPIKGAMYRPGVFEEGGVEPDWLPQWTFVGHYHKPNPPDRVQQCFGHAVWYCGSPMCHDFRDNCYGLTPEQQLRGIWMVEIENGKVTRFPQFFENPYCTYYLSLRADVVGGQIQDDWFLNHCRLPMSRTVMRLTPPAGRSIQPPDNLFGAKSLSILPEASQSSPDVKQLDPNAAPQQAVQQYVDSVSDERVQGLDRSFLKTVGEQLLQGNYPIP